MRWDEVRFPDVLVVTVAHDTAIALAGGRGGILNPARLEAAVVAPRNSYHRSLAALAAALVFGITNGHAFEDGNKRTGLLIGLAFLELNGRPIIINHGLWEAIITGVASGAVTQHQLEQSFSVAMGGDPGRIDP